MGSGVNYMSTGLQLIGLSKPSFQYAECLYGEDDTSAFTFQRHAKKPFSIPLGSFNNTSKNAWEERLAPTSQTNKRTDRNWHAAMILRF